ncbi:3-deoxy-manno-octulosonate cytidylyltransferase [Poseidonocella sedimentorum]|uniref:3-deoxy-manno-octulosonate cytidylyltransferase (CMP-KDO synthetase) n=1 Tax=Poseidonocella sedimentorum TaxID=871652 RepID=A0A1I6EDS6_9RHOB|nr:manno-octulosonate cytidylyltransferase [Poseidonocella sedimentorum]SFR15681.1 3-deoxy-manno-octulosonate cytidylyltransferase (CMP-KDO synthetase) [Poseidonocella sedimentorum]
MRTVILIPARYASSRYPGKPLAMLRQPDGRAKSLIRMSWEAARAVKGIDAVYVATDDTRIAEATEAFGGEVIMTDPACENGTVRCADALARLPGPAPDLVVNFQGDAPLTPPWFVEELVAAMAAEPGLAMATPILRCDRTAYSAFIEDRRNGRVGGTTVVADAAGRALYFSKEVIPFIDPGKLPDPVPVFHHVGVYAYRPEALRAYVAAGPCQLEELEGLEQLRFLHAGIPVRCVEVSARGRVFWELNNPHDVGRIEAALRAQQT